MTLTPAGVNLATHRFLPFATDARYEGSPSWSPDGRTIAYVAERDGIIQVMTRTLESSRSLQVTHAASDCRTPFWSSDGTRIFYISQGGERDALWSVAAISGTPRVVQENVSAATLSPKGEALVFLRENGDDAGFTQSLWVSTPLGAEPRRFGGDWGRGVTAGISYVRFSRDGRTVGLWANSKGSTSVANAVDSAEMWLFAFPSGEARRVLRSLGQMTRAHPFTWMADNKHVLFGADGIGRSPGTHLWTGDTVADRVEPLTMTTTSEYEPDLSPDGQQIVFTSDSSHYDLVEIPLDGSPIKSKSSKRTRGLGSDVGLDRTAVRVRDRSIRVPGDLAQRPGWQYREADSDEWQLQRCDLSAIAPRILARWPTTGVPAAQS